MESAPAPPQPAPSFAEVLQLVRSGREPPGVRQPFASPTGASPTASRLPPPAKPWESCPGQPLPESPRAQHGSGDSHSQHLENE
ncbi:hypothetical protein AV530_014684 [Patagioenas fasciata monilis]|uniref:Peroxisomal membrane protein PEX14-like KPWE domain-containing protein n=1 Tax=Patagioenas fasciata monilis TaxID=372326 RepID=A0A1V4KB35_PATFA|nr:hypothetical protein AV530_014684 [Patagioenas fasciata monilis]